MFTGIVRESAQVSLVSRKGRILSYGVATVGSWVRDLETGASVAVDGVCQTLTHKTGAILHFDAVDETLKKTSLSKLATGQKVHLEPALALGGALDGHLVYGHVDGVGYLAEKSEKAGRYDLAVRLPEKKNLERYVIEGGSICLSGLSLTVYKTEGELIWVSIIPETLKRTAIANWQVGTPINIEVDTIGKWIEKLWGTSPKDKGSFSKENGLSPKENGLSPKEKGTSLYTKLMENGF